MEGLDEFVEIFGDITVSQIIKFVFAGVFLIFVYRQVKIYFNKKVEEQNKRAKIEEERDQKLQEALDAVHQYPVYRKQSLEIQDKLETQINELKEMHREMTDKLKCMETETKNRERNKIRNTLLQSYRYYTNPDINPSKTWTAMESEAFWGLFQEYENAGGNGYMHEVVMPEMQLLTVVNPQGI